MVPDRLGRHVELHGNLLDPVLDDQESLGSAKTPEGRVGGQVGLAAMAAHPQLRHLRSRRS